MSWHKLLLKQLEDTSGTVDKLPEDMQKFAEEINRTYQKHIPEEDSIHKSNITTSLSPEPTKSELKSVQKELNKSEKLFSKVFTQSPIAIVLIDQNGYYLDVNHSMCEMTGYSRDEILGTHISEMTHPDDQLIDEDLTKKVFRKEIPHFQIEKRYLKRSGKIHWGKLTASVLWDDNSGKPLCGLGMIEDITERKKAKDQLIKAKDKAEELSQLKTSFMSNMSHEIRTPLNAIMGFADILESNLQDESKKNLAIRIKKGGDRLLNTIKSILDLGKIDSGNLQLDFKSCNLSEELREIRDLLTPLAREKRLKFSLDINEEPACAHVDPHYFGQIINNLVSNAIKFTNEGSVSITLDKNQQSDGSEWIAITVKDTGIGIPKSFIPHLFDEFKQESSGTNRKHEGSGLGLTITKKLIKKLNGKIEVESQPNVGSKFTVSFPSVEVPFDKNEKIDNQSNLSMLESKTSIFGKKIDTPHILVVEDNIDSQFIIKNFLDHCCSLHIVSRADDAISKFQNHIYDVILMDINLGDNRDGFDLLKIIRNDAKNSTTPVIAITAYGYNNDELNFEDAGFCAYLSKPFDRQKLIGVINDTLTQS